LLTILLILALLTTSSAADFDAGTEAYKRGEFGAAFLEWRPLAEQGNASAQYNLGLMYDLGKGVLKNDVKAMHWYRLAAEQGIVEAQYAIGSMYAHGDGIPKDIVEAIRWFRKAAEQGHVWAQYNLGLGYTDGRGVLKDETEGYAWLSIAVAQDSELDVHQRDVLARKMTPTQLATAKQLAREYWEAYVLSFRD